MIAIFQNVMSRWIVYLWVTTNLIIYVLNMSKWMYVGTKLEIAEKRDVDVGMC